MGVEKTGKYVTLNEQPTPFIYLPYAQEYVPRVSLVVRTAGPTVIPAVRAIVAELNPNLPIIGTFTLDGLSTIALLPQRLAGWHRRRAGRGRARSSPASASTA